MKCAEATGDYRGTSLIRNRAPLGPYSRTMPRVLGGSAVSDGRGTPVQVEACQPDAPVHF